MSTSVSPATWLCTWIVQMKHAEGFGQPVHICAKTHFSSLGQSQYEESWKKNELCHDSRGSSVLGKYLHRNRGYTESVCLNTPSPQWGGWGMGDGGWGFNSALTSPITQLKDKLASTPLDILMLLAMLTQWLWCMRSINPMHCITRSSTQLAGRQCCWADEALHWKLTRWRRPCVRGVTQHSDTTQWHNCCVTATWSFWFKLCECVWHDASDPILNISWWHWYWIS